MSLSALTMQRARKSVAASVLFRVGLLHVIFFFFYLSNEIALALWKQPEDKEMRHSKPAAALTFRS